MSGTLVAGAGVAGTAAALALLRRGATVTVVNRASTPALARLAAAGDRVVVADEPPAELLDGVSDVVVSPGFAPHHPLAARAVAAGLDVYSEPELAWRLRGPDAPAWLAVTGTNGKTTTVTMLASILRAAGLRSAALGNIGEPLVEATGYDVIAVELSSFQLHWSRTLAPQAGALLNLADDHLDWHGDFAAYAGAKTAIWRAATPEGGGTAVGNLDDPRVAALLGAVPGRAVGFTLGPPAPGQLGVRDGMLVDATGAALIEAGMVRPPGAHNVANALAAAALAGAHGVPAEAIGQGLAKYTPEPHRNAFVATVSGVSYVDDSKATNPHAALASLTAYSRIVWIAGGQLKGVDVGDLVAQVADRLTGAVLLASVALLLGIGLVMVFSATSVEAYAESGNAFTSVTKQLASAGVGLVAFWVCQRLPARTFRGLSQLALVVCLLLMVVLDLLGLIAAMRDQPVSLGPFHSDDQWLYFGPLQVQPSELGKLGLVLWGADVLVRKGSTIGHWRELATPLFPVAGLLMILVGYNDFGTMVCLLVLFVGLPWAAGVRLRVFAGMFTVAVIGMTMLILLPGQKDRRLGRLTTFLDPSAADPQEKGYHVFRGLWANAGGGWFGVGLGESRTKWGRLPNGHNDFIFALIGEELGVVGCFVVLALFAVLAYTGLRIARRVDDPYRRLVAAGITTWLVGQATINIGGVTGLLPITGLPLPFISEGGSALVVALAAAGILTSFARAEPDAARALHARPPRRWVRLLWAPLPPLPRSRSGALSRSGAGRGAERSP